MEVTMTPQGLPYELVSLCERLAAAVTTAGRQNGWRIQQFGRSGFNTDVIVGQTILKITTSGTPLHDGSGAAIRFQRTGHDRSFSVRRGSDGGLELADDAGLPITVERFVELVGQACDAPVRGTVSLPTPLQRLCEHIIRATVSTGQDHGWRVQTFGASGCSLDVIVGATIVKLTTAGAPAADGAGAQLRLEAHGQERVFSTRMARSGRLELCDGEGHTVRAERLLELIGDACGTPLLTDPPLPPPLQRLCERIASYVVKRGGDLGWRVTPFGSRGWSADVVVGQSIVKVTTEPRDTPDGAGTEVWIKRPGFERRFTARAEGDGELVLIDGTSGPTSPVTPITLERFIEVLADACNTPIKDERPFPDPLARLCERLAILAANLANDNGGRFLQFGSWGVNGDVIIGANILKLTTSGHAASDGTGATFRMSRPGWERTFGTQVAADGELALTEHGAATDLRAFLEALAEGANASLNEVEALPAPLQRLHEKIASTVVTAGNDHGWRVRQFGSVGFNADLSVGTNLVKVTTEGRPAIDGTGSILRVKRPGHDRVFQSRLGRSGELGLSDDAGALVSMEQLVEVLKAVCAS
jgi:hypothetical protein